MSNKSIFVVIVLVILAAGLGIAIYYNSQNQSADVIPFVQNNNTIPTPAKSTVQSLIDSNPGPNATADQLKTYSAKVFQASTESLSLDVSGCSPKPDVLHIKLDGSFSIKNTDSISHILVNGTVINLVVPANSDKVSTLKLTNGIYAYSCDSKIVGIIMVSP